MKFAVNASIMFIFQKEAGKRRKRNKPIISTTQICLLSFCFWVLRPPLAKTCTQEKRSYGRRQLGYEVAEGCEQERKLEWSRRAVSSRS